VAIISKPYLSVLRRILLSFSRTLTLIQVKGENLVLINEKEIYFIDIHNNRKIFDADWKEEYGLLVIQMNCSKLEVIINDTTLNPKVYFDYLMIRWLDNNLFAICVTEDIAYFYSSFDPVLYSLLHLG
jgi:hypothetical protein